MRGLDLRLGWFVLAHDLLPVGERLNTKIRELERAPTVQRAGQLAIELEGARLAVRQIHLALEVEAAKRNRT